MDKQKLKAALLAVAIFGIIVGGVELHLDADYAIVWGLVLVIGIISVVCTVLFEIIRAFENPDP